MTWALLFEQVSEASRGLFGAFFCKALYSHDCVVWLVLAVRTRVVVVVATPLFLVVVVAARVVFALAVNGVVLGVRLVFLVGS
jgi:hypothetical protein